MRILRQTIKTGWAYGTISWLGNSIVDWADGGRCYELDGGKSQLGVYSYAYSFDRCITSRDGQYAFIYVNRGTKGLLLKNGDLIREINRSYYHAGTYEYPAVFYTSPDGRTYLVHCPVNYCQLDFEEVETGKIVTHVPGRAPQDIFHSRLEISPDNKFLMVRGWVWHPLDVIYMYDIQACLSDPKTLDSGICTADGPFEKSVGAFINEHEILLGSLEPDDDFPMNHLAVWNFKSGTVKNSVKVSGPFGNIVGIHNTIAWDFYQYPKIIDIQTGIVLDKMEDVQTGKQVSSIIAAGDVPRIIFNRDLNKVAVATSDDLIDVFSLRLPDPYQTTPVF